MNDEMKALIDNETFELVPPPTNRDIVGGKWVYTVLAGKWLRFKQLNQFAFHAKRNVEAIFAKFAKKRATQFRLAQHQQRNKSSLANHLKTHSDKGEKTLANDAIREDSPLAKSALQAYKMLKSASTSQVQQKCGGDGMGERIEIMEVDERELGKDTAGHATDELSCKIVSGVSESESWEETDEKDESEEIVRVNAVSKTSKAASKHQPS
ncbi:uncharacterized protein LOC124440968 [Xenia sp. Carnegie-2017]|uniref:uncharacterized protein LOC124440968 n=1 Tax=Xenia sp. Carnegie-2017 TaxID=2897299 RepID=UPI001F03759B|nr:uncharacterized protein LOC124440968 [Xenia sp. Carnegie-2017]